MTNVITPNVYESVLNVPGDSGINFLFASKPMIANGAMIGETCPAAIQYRCLHSRKYCYHPILQNRFHYWHWRKYIHKAFPKNRDTTDYSTRRMASRPIQFQDDEAMYAASAVKPFIRNADNKVISAAIFTSLASTLCPMNSGVRPTIKPEMNTAMMMNIK